MKTVNLTDEEVEYILDSISLNKESLDQCCKDEVPIVNYITPEEAKKEYFLLGSLFGKLS